MTTTRTHKHFAETSFEPTTHYLQTTSELKEAVDLIDTVRSSMSKEQQFFLLPKTVDFMKNKIAIGDAVLGLRAENGQLIGTATLTRLNHWTDVQDFEAMPFIGFLMNEKACIRQSVCRHPAYKSMRIAPHIYALAENWCAENGITRLIARVVDNNTACLNALARNNYQILSNGIDRKDGYSFHYIGKEIAPASAHPYDLMGFPRESAQNTSGEADTRSR